MTKARMGRPPTLEEPAILSVRVSKKLLERIDQLAAMMTAASPYALPANRSQAARILLEHASTRFAVPTGHEPKPRGEVLHPRSRYGARARAGGQAAGHGEANGQGQEGIGRRIDGGR